MGHRGVGTSKGRGERPSAELPGFPHSRENMDHDGGIL